MSRVVWLCGTSGVGKSTAAVELVQVLAEQGTSARMIDADQLRLAAGIEAAEQDLVAAGLQAVSSRLDVEVLVVAGMARDESELARLLPSVPRERVLVAQLRADESAVRDRVVARGWLVELADSSIEYARGMAETFGDVVIDTSGLSPRDVAERVAEALPQVEAPRLVVVSGPRGAGVSTAGFELFRQLATDGTRVGYVDTRQMAGLAAEGARAQAQVLADAGCDLVLVAADAEAARDLVGREPVAIFWLAASDGVRRARLEARAAGQGPPTADDPLRGLQGAAFESVVDEGHGQAERGPIVGAEVIDTDDLSPAEVAEQVVARLRH